MIEAILLLGPTASGKTPIGDELDRRGLGDRRCVHFDFGAQLREAAARGTGGALTEADVAVIRHVLDAGVLLEDHQFSIARKILERFINEHGDEPGSLVVLNGMPRHVGQAEGVEGLVSVVAVVELACTAEVVAERICRDTGGDRASRTDDETDAVTRRLTVYQERTRPLVMHYKSRGVRTIQLKVGSETGAAELAARLNRYKW
jgi:adenylate kinase